MDVLKSLNERVHIKYSFKSNVHEKLLKENFPLERNNYIRMWKSYVTFVRKCQLNDHLMSLLPLLDYFTL